MHIPRYANRMDGNPKCWHAYPNRRTHEVNASLQPHCIREMQIGMKRKCGYEKWQVWVCTELNPLWMGWPWICQRSSNLELARGQSHWSRWRLVLTSESRIFDGPKKFLYSPERKSYDQATQGMTYVEELFTWKIQSNLSRSHYSGIWCTDRQIFGAVSKWQNGGMGTVTRAGLKNVG